MNDSAFSRRTVTLLPGEGEWGAAFQDLLEVLEAAGAGLTWERYDAGDESQRILGDPLPFAVVQSVERNRVCLKSPRLETPGVRAPGVDGRLRQGLALSTTVRRVRGGPGNPVDTAIVTAMAASGEHLVVPGVAESFAVISEAEVERSTRAALDLARALEMSRVVAVLPGAGSPLAARLFEQGFERARQGAVDLEGECLPVSAVIGRLVSGAAGRGVLVVPGQHFETLAEIAIAAAGPSAGVATVRLGPRAAVFEPGADRREEPSLASLFLSATVLLRHVGATEAAARLERGVDETLAADTGPVTLLARAVAARLR